MEDSSLEDLILVIARGLVNKPEEVKVEKVDSASDYDDLVVYRLHVDEEDMGRIIGKQGRIAKSIRQIVRSAAIRKGVKTTVEIV